jgi:Na+/proline symporter
MDTVFGFELSRIIEFVVIGSYMLIMVAVSLAFANFNKDSSDYFRSGCRAKWWMVGSSAFMTAFSAWTFTGAAGSAYEAGWSVMLIFFGNAVGLAGNAIFMAHRYRQMRLTTGAEIIRRRFDVVNEQFNAYLGFVTSVFYGSIHLYGVSIFTSAVFGFDIHQTIVVLGVVVLFYSSIGGSWAVRATDFLQSLILFPISILVAVLALRHMGGLGGFFDAIEAAGLSNHFRLINDKEFSGRLVDFSILYAIAVILQHTLGANGIASGNRYFAAKDGREARKAAWLACGMMIFGAFIWFIPPMVARLAFAAEVEATNIAKPAEAAYAVASLNLLPVGMSGLVVVAMFAATMSSMDTGLNNNAALLVRNILPCLLRVFGLPQPSEANQLRIGRIWTFVCGGIIVSLALYFAAQKGQGIFDKMVYLGLLSASGCLVMVLAIFVRKVPHWAGIFVAVAGVPMPLLSMISGREFVRDIPLLASQWPFHWSTLANMTWGALLFLATMPFWKYAKPEYRRQLNTFFETMETPIDFEKEVGNDVDAKQELTIGIFALIIGLAICLIMLVPGNSWGIDGRLGILFVGGSVALVGLGLLYSSKKSRERMVAEKPEVPICMLVPEEPGV